jgi:hypothetical protein
MGLKDLLKRAELPHVNRWIVSLTPASCTPYDYAPLLRG